MAIGSNAESELYQRLLRDSSGSMEGCMTSWSTESQSRGSDSTCISVMSRSHASSRPVSSIATAPISISAL